MHDEVHVFDVADLIDLVTNAVLSKLRLVKHLGGDLIDHFNRIFGCVLNAHNRFSIKEREDGCLDRRGLFAFCANDKEHTLVILDLGEDEEYEECNDAAHAGNEEVAYTAADTNDDCPEDVYSVSHILNGCTETDDGERADHTQGESHVVTDNGHDRARKHGENNEGGVEFLAVNGSSVSEVVREINNCAKDRGENNVHNDCLPGQVLLAFN